MGMSDFEEFLEKSKLANVIPVIKTLPADLLTPLSVYLKLSKDTEDSFLLESVEGGETLARYSFIGVDPKMIVSGNDRAITIPTKSDRTEKAVSMFAFLRDHFAINKVLDDADMPSFIGGAIGFFGFSCAGWFEPTIRDDQGEANHAGCACHAAHARFTIAGTARRSGRYPRRADRHRKRPHPRTG